jgi:hypothetical protein
MKNLIIGAVILLVLLPISKCYNLPEAGACVIAGVMFLVNVKSK